ncbi:MAG: DUF5717 family protein [Lachnospiraceae bacterium]|jgi:hypothetical protein|nr:DUF5717 family protein [Lachnospiraceae bacterium]
MKNKVLKFSKGDFKKQNPSIKFSENNILLIVGEGEIGHGFFEIISTSNFKVRGLVYSSSYRIKLKNSGFEGYKCKIEYTYNGSGLLPGHVENSALTVVCNGGEYNIPFTTIIERPYIMTSYGKVQNVEDFKKLAIKDYMEAAKLFKSDGFYEILKYENERNFNLYQNMRTWSLSEQMLEEFLVAIKLKEVIFLSFSGEGMMFEDIKESTKGVLTLMKNTWGYMSIHVEAEGDFIKVIHPDITTEDFVGSSYEFEYLILPKNLHGGRNFGKLKFITPYEVMTYDIEVRQNLQLNPNHHMAEFYLAGIIKEYVSYKAGKMTKSEWVESALDKIRTLRKLDPSNEIYQLLHTHIYFIDGRVEDAKWILENYNYNKFAIAKDPTINCYYQYLTALVRDNREYEERVLADIKKTYVFNPSSWLLLYMIVHLDYKYKTNPYKKLEAIEKQFGYENHEILYYLEAYSCYEEKPTLLKKLGNFEIQVFNFATKYGFMTKELALFIANFISQTKEFSLILFNILTRIYTMYKEPMILSTICTLLIKGRKTDKTAFNWYHKAVVLDIKIAKLFEYYMMSLEEDYLREALPRPIFLYFMHGHILDYKKAAILYSNLLTYAGDDEELFLGYREKMVTFTWQQVEARHINESLRVLYKKFCVEDDMDEERAKALFDVCFAYQVKTKVPNIHSVIIVEPNGEIKQRVPYFKDSGAIVYLYDKESRIVWLSKSGNYFADSIVFESKRLCYEPRLIDLCKKFGVGEQILRPAKEKVEVTFDNIKTYGKACFEDKDVFTLVSKHISDTDYEKDDFVTAVAFYLFKKFTFDKVTLNYLANHYVGPTDNMKMLWRALKTYEVPAYKIGERIITQMVFSENLYGEEPIFIDAYNNDSLYFRLKQAYLSFISMEYVVKCRKIDTTIFEIIARELDMKEELPDICKAAVLIYYSSAKIPEEYLETIHHTFKELCAKQIIFSEYSNYPNDWLVETQLYNKVILEIRTEKNSKIRLSYKMKRGEKEEIGFHSEIIKPIFDKIFVKTFTLFTGEVLSYYTEELSGKKIIKSEEKEITNTKVIKFGKFGKLNAISLSDQDKKRRLMLNYVEEDILADKFFLK